MMASCLLAEITGDPAAVVPHAGLAIMFEIWPLKLREMKGHAPIFYGSS